MTRYYGRPVPGTDRMPDRWRMSQEWSPTLTSGDRVPLPSPELTIDRDAVLWSASERDRAGRPLLVLLHGYASNEADLFGISAYLPLEPVIASVRAPIPEGQGFAW